MSSIVRFSTTSIDTQPPERAPAATPPDAHRPHLYHPRANQSTHEAQPIPRVTQSSYHPCSPDEHAAIRACSVADRRRRWASMPCVDVVRRGQAISRDPPGSKCPSSVAFVDPPSHGPTTRARRWEAKTPRVYDLSHVSTADPTPSASSGSGRRADTALRRGARRTWR